jgi:hypothetical protein
MLLAPLPFEYVRLLDPGDRVRRKPGREGETRIRRSLPAGRPS